MGQRANLLIITPTGYDLYYTHWRANTLPFDLFWGPAHAEAFIREQRAVEGEDGWLDTVWAEGGAVFDPLRRILLFYGGEDVLFDAPLRRVYLELMRASWPGWTIRWAHEGIVEIAEYVKRDRSSVIVDREPDKCLANLAQKGEFTQSVATVREAGLTFYPLIGWAEYYLVSGPRVLESHLENVTTDRHAVDVSSIVGGLHIDVPQQRVDYWLAYARYQPRQIQAAWPGWQVVWHHDRYEDHAELAVECADFRVPDRNYMLDNLADSLLRETQPVDVIATATAIEQHQGEHVEINPYALRDDVLNLPANMRREILHRALKAVHER
jgi:hypothetical protein